MSRTVSAAYEARNKGEMPVAASIAAPYDIQGCSMSGLVTTHDSRISTKHPLRHAITNAIRCIAGYYTDSKGDVFRRFATTSPQELALGQISEVRNGMNYFLTSLSVFTTHEPCVMCSMALLHSRVKEVFYLHPMPQTGGCGGAVCLPTLKGVNHRFKIYHWINKPSSWNTKRIHLDLCVDA